MKLIAQAPCRISLIGGGTDVDPFASQHGGKIFNFAINLYNLATLTPSQNKQITLQALGEEKIISNLDQPLQYHQDPEFDLIYAIINHFRPHIHSGFSLKLTSTKKDLLGLGRSGSAAVAIIAVFNAWLKQNLSRLDMGLLASRLEVEELGWPGGKQDALAAAFGGINLMTFGPGKDVKVIPVKLSPQTIKNLKQRTFMVFIGGQRHPAKQQQKLVKGMSDKHKLKALLALRDAVDGALKATNQQDWQVLGKILHQAWLNKKKSNPAVSNQRIDKLYQIARKNGAYGGKISGSGGAGHMFFIAPPEKKLAAIKSLVAAGAELIDFNFDSKGVTVIKK
jgi:D-glycero-alpha-D-manno-heptose-7-phosphate kinase